MMKKELYENLVNLINGFLVIVSCVTFMCRSPIDTSPDNCRDLDP